MHRRMTERIVRYGAGFNPLGRALAVIPPQIEEGFSTFCIKPSQFTDDPSDVGRLCREIIRRVSDFDVPARS
jgi:hypothetical protein